MQEGQKIAYKILVVGDVGVGKTSLIKRYVHKIFSTEYKTTIGVDLAVKEIQLNNTNIELQLWDIAGQERFANLTRVYYKHAVGALIVFDKTRVATFDSVKKWKTDIDKKVFLPVSERPIPCVLLANKCDLMQVVLDPKDMDAYCSENGFIAWFETSAKQGTNIDVAVKTLVEAILESLKQEKISKKRKEEEEKAIITMDPLQSYKEKRKMDEIVENQRCTC